MLQLLPTLHDPPLRLCHDALIAPPVAEITRSKTLPVLMKLNVSPLSEPG